MLLAPRRKHGRRIGRIRENNMYRTLLIGTPLAAARIAFKHFGMRCLKALR